MGYEVECEVETLLDKDSIHGAVLDDITLREITSSKTGNIVRFLKFKFRVTRPGHGYGQDIVGKIVYAETFAQMSTRPGNAFREWAEAILGREIPPGMKVDTDDLIGLPCDIVIGHEPDYKNPALIWERVISVLPSSDPNASSDPWASPSQPSYGNAEESPF